MLNIKKNLLGESPTENLDLFKLLESIADSDTETFSLGAVKQRIEVKLWNNSAPSCKYQEFIS